jgi:hypothetical protein
VVFSALPQNVGPVVGGFCLFFAGTGYQKNQCRFWCGCGSLHVLVGLFCLYFLAIFCDESINTDLTSDSSIGFVVSNDVRPVIGSIEWQVSWSENLV